MFENFNIDMKGNVETNSSDRVNAIGNTKRKYPNNEQQNSSCMKANLHFSVDNGFGYLEIFI